MLGAYMDPYNDFSGFEITENFFVTDSSGNVDADKTALLRQIEATAPGTVTQAASSSFDWNSLVENLSQLVGSVVQAEAQRDLLKANLARAQQGLPPLNAQQYMPGVNVGVSSDTQTMIYVLGGLLAAAIVLPQLMKGSSGKRRRR